MKKGEAIKVAKVIGMIVLVICFVLILTLLVFDTSKEVLNKCTNPNVSLKDKRIDYRCSEYLIVNNSFVNLGG